MKYRVTKTYGHEQGLSCCFRQWRASSHCKFLHGYALSFKLVFECETLDERNWVIDFGGLRQIKEWLQFEFDHTLAIAEDDPDFSYLMGLDQFGLANVRTFAAGVGCERFATHVASYVTGWLKSQPDLSKRGVRIIEVECREHSGNASSWVSGGANV